MEEQPIIYTADWVLPVTAPPIPQGAIIARAGTIEAVGTRAELTKDKGARVLNYGPHLLLPGLVNAHTHLEFSALKGKVGQCRSFPEWLKKAAWQRMLVRREKIVEAAKAGVRELIVSGTALVGDVANLTDTGLLLKGLPITGVIFNEVIGLKASKAPEVFRQRQAAVASSGAQTGIVRSISPHAPYSVSPELFRLIKEHCQEQGLVTSVHLSESPEEVELCTKGTGEIRDLLKWAGMWDRDWRAPGVTPVTYLSDLGFITETTVAVHLTKVSGDDIELLKRSGASACLCVRSNQMTGVGLPPAEALLDAGLNICLGTDSLASNWDLNILNEMWAVKRAFPEISDQTILSMATINGARALGFGHRLGSFDPGKEAFVLACPLAATGDDPVAALFNLQATLKRVVP